MTAPISGCTVGELLAEAARRWPALDAVVAPERGVRQSFAELDRAADDVASACVAAGLEPGDRAVVWAVNLPEWVALQYGLARAGVVLVTANTALKLAEIRYILGKCRARALFFGRGTPTNDFGATLAALDRTGVPALATLVGLEGAAAPGSLPYREFLAAGTAGSAAAARARGARLGCGELVNMQYTSGTTGFPKGVMLSHRNIVQNAAAIAPVLGFEAGDRLALAVPLFHCFGCVIGTLVAHATGTALVLNDVFQADQVLDTAAAERCTALYGVPTMFLAELEAQRRRPRDLSRLRVGVMAGAACPEALVRSVVRELPLPGLAIAYGLTEASPGVTLSAPGDPLDVRATTIGRRLPGVEVKIVRPGSLDELPHGAPGELLTRGEHVMLGYDGEPEATAQAITADGWLRTGDLAVELAGGCFQIVGRIKELIIRGGENISPAEVEDVLRGHPAVADAAVFGIRSEFFGEEVAAAVRLLPGRTATDRELMDFVQARLADHKRPTRVLFVDAFPLTGSGKIQRFKLRELAERGG